MFEYVKTVVFQVTSDCNLRCTYCFVKDKHAQDIVTFGKFKSIVNRIIQDRLKGETKKTLLEFCFHGGEPTLVGPEYLEQIIGYAHKTFSKHNVAFKLTLQTNLTLLNETYYPFLKKYNVHVSGSCDGFGHANDKRTTKYGKQHYMKIFKSLEKEHITFSNLVVAHRGNIDTILSFQNVFWKKFGRRMKVNYVEDVHNDVATTMNVKPEEYFKKVILKDMQKFIERKYDSISYTVLDYIQKFIESRLLVSQKTLPLGGSCYTRFCGAGSRIIGVDSQGRCYLCGRFMDNEPAAYLGRVGFPEAFDATALRKIIKFNSMQTKLIRDLGCDVCQANKICDHGCMAMFYKKNNEWGIHKDFVCELYKTIIQFLVRHEVSLTKAYMNYLLEEQNACAIKMQLRDNARINKRALFFKILKELHYCYAVHLAENKRTVLIQISNHAGVGSKERV